MRRNSYSWASTRTLRSHDLCCHSNYNTGELSELELSAVDVLDTAMTWCRRRMADSSNSDSLAHLLQLSDALRSTETIEGAVKMARKHIWFAAL